MYINKKFHQGKNTLKINTDLLILTEFCLGKIDL